ncbi:MAG: peptidase C11 [Lachnospiraceae bacterium]|nr:peptidase C11 [Lachnospiraceae bacterium]
MERPAGRQKNVSGGGSGVHRRGSGTGSGPVGRGSAFGSGGGGFHGSSGPSGGFPGGRPPRRYGGYPSGGGGLGRLIIGILALLLVGGGALVSSVFNAILGGGNTGVSEENSYQNTQSSQTASSSSGSSYSSGRGEVNRAVAPEAREKYTTVYGDGSDQVTLMVYLCGTDLESKYGMATNDLNEMASAALSDKVNIIAYTGGCKAWKTQGISSAVNQIYKVERGGVRLLEKDMGSRPMTDPATLTSFIKYCASNYPANRNMLIFWDHGGGSLSGYGYDEKFPGSGSMTLDGIDQALGDAGMKFDFIGFDACLMATIETDLMIADYADYRISSEETEPGVGWYYTEWLTKLSADPSMSTLDIGQQIVDDFIETCDKRCPGQKTTLSLVDLSELSQTIGEDFKAFSSSTQELIKQDQYKQVSDARASSREFAQSSKIDQVDLVDFANRLGTDEGAELAKTLQAAVKYNRAGIGMSNANGISIYFPYRKAANVSKAVNTYSRIGLDSSYSDCIREFASLEVSGQQVSSGQGTTLPINSLLGTSSLGSSLQTFSQIAGIVNALSSGSSSSIPADFFSGRTMSEEETAKYISEYQFDGGSLSWQRASDGKPYLSLPEEQWDLVHSVDQNLYYDDGEGYVDLGLDNLFDFDEDGNLLPDMDKTWLSVNGQPVAYYHLDTVEEDGGNVMTGYIPALLNGERVELHVLFDAAHPDGTILGANPNYGGETDTVARGLIELQDGDTLDFLCDFYSYEGDFQDSYFLGEQLTVNGPLTLSNTYVGEKVLIIYRFTDIFEQNYFTPALQ